MKIFEKNGKCNFVDKNNILLGFETETNCCEHYGWFISKTEENIIIEDSKTPDVEKYDFDKEYFKRIDDEDVFCDGGGMVIFNFFRD